MYFTSFYSVSVVDFEQVNEMHQTGFRLLKKKG